MPTENELPQPIISRPKRNGDAGAIRAGRAIVNVDVVSTMILFALGTQVQIGSDRDIDGEIIGINITNDGAQYQVAWWNGRTRQAEWLYPQEIMPVDSAGRMKIGFK